MMRLSKIHILVVLLAALILTGCSNDSGKTSNVASAEDSLTRPDSEVSGAKIYLYDRGQVTSAIVSEKIIKFEEIDSTMAYQLDIDIFDSTGHVSTQVVGDSGIIRENRGVINIYGNVVVITDDSTKLETEYLWWDSNTDRIKTDAFVRITRGEDIITGWGLDADNRLKDFKILSQVSGTIEDPEKLQE
ncbi:MAG: LPS export ABC transporter periplasmic protein LptC [Candidatus Zixiibacteriota bacterium]